MAGDEFDAAVKTLHWSDRELAAMLGCSRALPSQWRTKRRPIPPEVAAWLRRRVADAQADPPPANWRKQAA